MFIHFIVFEGKKDSSASARECCFPEKMMKYVALNVRLPPFKKPTTVFLHFLCCFRKRIYSTFQLQAFHFDQVYLSLGYDDSYVYESGCYSSRITSGNATAFQDGNSVLFTFVGRL